MMETWEDPWATPVAPDEDRTFRPRRWFKPGSSPGVGASSAVQRVPPLPSPLRRLGDVLLPEAVAMRDRLRDAGHRAAVQDLRRTTTPSVRFLFWPKPGPLAPVGDRPRFTIEFSWGSPEPGRLAVRHWEGEKREDAEYEGSIAPTELGRQWCHQRFLIFVGKALSRV